MLRRVARVLRVVLLLLGIGLLVWLPISFFFVASAISANQNGGIIITTEGSVWSWWPEDFSLQDAAEIDVSIQRMNVPILRREALVPAFEHVVDEYRVTRPQFYVSLPLWLLAAICLAWPVTSFILHRRRHKRGFPVEPKASESEAPKVRQ